MTIHGEIKQCMKRGAKDLQRDALMVTKVWNGKMNGEVIMKGMGAETNRRKKTERNSRDEMLNKTMAGWEGSGIEGRRGKFWKMEGSTRENDWECRLLFIGTVEDVKGGNNSEYYGPFCWFEILFQGKSSREIKNAIFKDNETKIERWTSTVAVLTITLERKLVKIKKNWWSLKKFWNWNHMWIRPLILMRLRDWTQPPLSLLDLTNALK